MVAFRARGLGWQAGTAVAAAGAEAGFEAGRSPIAPEPCDGHRDRGHERQRPEWNRKQLQVLGVGVVVEPQHGPAWAVGAMQAEFGNVVFVDPLGDADLAVGQFDLVARLVDPFDWNEDGKEPESQARDEPDDAGFGEVAWLCVRGGHERRLCAVRLFNGQTAYSK